MAHNFREFVEQPEIWKIPRAEYLKELQERWDQLNKEYDAVLARYDMNKERPQGGDWWSRYGHDLDIGHGMTQVRWWHKKLLNARNKANQQLTTAGNRHYKAVQKALKAKLPVPPEVLKDYSWLTK